MKTLYGIALAVALTATAAVAATQEAVPPQSTAPTRQPVHVSGGVMAGMILKKRQPVLPPIAATDHISGATVLHAIIAKDGTIRSLDVISGPQALRAPIMEAVRQWVYRPYLLNGQPVEVDTTITINISMGAPADL